MSIKIITFGRVVWALTIGIFLNLIYIIYLVAYPFQTIDFKNSPFPIVNGMTQRQIEGDPSLVNKTKTINAGETLEFQVSLCRYTEVPTQFTQTLTGPTTITLVAGAFATSEVGCRSIISKSAVIPDYAPSGVYHLDITTCWQVTPLKNSCKSLKTRDFIVNNN